MRRLRFPVLWFLVFTYVLTAAGQGVHLYVVHRLSAGTAGMPIEESPVWAWMPYSFYVTNVGPSLVCLLMTFYLYGRAGLQRLAVQLAPWSAGRAWPVLAVCLLLPLLIISLAFSFLAAFGLSDPPGSWNLFTYLYGAFIGGGLIGPGLCEELGWRGFMLPHLQRRYSALVSSMIVGVAWAFWHWPNFVFSSEPDRWWQLVACVPVSMAVSVLFTWVYNSTGGSLFAVVALHGARVAASSLAPPDSAGWALVYGIALLIHAIIVLGLVWRYGAANLSWRDRVVSGWPNLPPRQAGESTTGSAEPLQASGTGEL